MSLADVVANTSNGTVVQPPGAFQGTKSFKGALQKVTLRERSSDIGDLKDCARATIIFKTTADLIRAKNAVVASDAFQAVKHHQKALKDRYDSGTSKEMKKFNVGAQKSGYKDIKFFIKLPKSNTVAELQLNTGVMAEAKEQEHVIYEILRTTKDTSSAFNVTNADILKGVQKHMNSNWFDKARRTTLGVNMELKVLEGMIQQFQNSGYKQLNVSKQQAEALMKVANSLYAYATRQLATQL